MTIISARKQRGFIHAHKPDPMDSVKHKGLWLLAGFIFGAWLMLWVASGKSMWDNRHWQCKVYSPVNGECVVYVNTEERSRYD